MMLLTVDRLAHRYGLLPSEVIHRADTYDLEVLGASSKWEQHQAKEQERKRVFGKKGAKAVPPPARDLSQKELLNIISQTKRQRKK